MLLGDGSLGESKDPGDGHHPQRFGFAIVPVNNRPILCRLLKRESVIGLNPTPVTLLFASVVREGPVELKYSKVFRSP